MIAAILFISFAVLLVAGAPIAVCLGSSSIMAMLIQGAGRPVSTIMSSLPFLFSASTSKFVLLAIPFFILAGNIMEKAEISERLINLAEACVGHVKGGLAIVCVIVARFFAAIEKYLEHPELLEVPPETVKYDQGVEYHEPKLKKD